MKSSILPLQFGKHAFSLLEVITAIAILGILAALAIQPGNEAWTGSKITKLESDVATVNQAIQVYLANGGSLDGISDTQTILDKMKTVRGGDDAEVYVGLRDSMIDKRLAVRLQTESEAGSADPRALWSPTKQYFYLATSGGIGVKEFYLDESLAAVDYGSEVRTNSTISYNPVNGWIWTYADSGAAALPNPTFIPTNVIEVISNTDSSDEETTESTDDSPGPEPEYIDLDAPAILPTAWTFDSTDMPEISVTLSNPNSALISKTIYQINSDGWLDYTDPFTLDWEDYPYGAAIQAQAVATIDFVNDSAIASASLEAAETTPEEEFIDDFVVSGLGAFTWFSIGSSSSFTGDSSQIQGAVAVGPDATFEINQKAGVPADLYADPTATLSKSGGEAATPQERDLSGDKAEVLRLNTVALGLTATQSYTKVNSSTTITGTSENGMNVLSLGSVRLTSPSDVLTIQASNPDDYFIINITEELTLTAPGVFVVEGVDPSHVLFNIAPGADVYIGGNNWILDVTILAPQSEVDVKGTATLSGGIYTGDGSSLGGTAILTNSTVFGGAGL